MLYNDSNNWVKYIQHVLSFEGQLDKDPRDTASKCVQAGQYHTNRGVTFCDFKDRAQSLGISPVSYERFLNLTDEDSAKFLYSYYKDVKGSDLPDSLALAVTEAGWGSGVERAYKHLYDALKNLGQTATTKQEARDKSKLLPEKVLFDEYIKQRRLYYDFLTSSPKYAPFKNGWNRRLKSFYDSFNPDVIGQKKKLGLGLALLLAIFLIAYLVTSKN